jgi:hypothetical protein
MPHYRIKLRKTVEFVVRVEGYTEMNALNKALHAAFDYDDRDSIETIIVLVEEETPHFIETERKLLEKKNEGY